MKREMDRLFDRFVDELPARPGLGTWSPALDVLETADAVVVKAEVPGMDPRDIQLQIQDQTLVLRGEKRQEKEEKGEQYYRSERSYGAFARLVRLPAPVDPGRATATFKQGLLTVSLPKAPAARGSLIPIKAE
jgi:HSP20 family protein